MPNIGTAFEEDTAIIFSDEGDDAELQISYGGNLDWYLQIKYKDALDRFHTGAIRVCTSGSAQPQWFTDLVAGMFAALKGDRPHAALLFKQAAEHVMEPSSREEQFHNRKKEKEE
jgi:hypothetical protein